MHETRGEKVFDYCYDANGQLYAVSYKANSSTNAVTYYYAHNWRGDITSIYDGEGNMVAKYEYDAWGNVLTVTNSNNSEITDPNHIANLNPFRYCSYYYDSESGLYYLMSRYYDPVVHRFLNADGYFQSGDNILDTNMNAYCQNNPIMNSDPTGNHPSDVICGNPTCPMCNLDRRKYLQTEKGLRNYNKYHGTNYDYVDDNGQFKYYNVGEKIQQSFLTIINSLEVDADVGYGLGAEFNTLDLVGIEALAQFSPLSIHIDYNNIYFGEKASSQLGLTVMGWDLGSYGESEFMDCLSDETIINSGESHVIGFSSGGYIIIGASFSAGINIDYIANEFQYIWW